MQDTALQRGAKAARQVLVDETRPTNEAHAQEVKQLLESLRHALRNLGQRSVWQVTAQACAADVLAGGVIARVANGRRSLIVGRISRAFALAHIRAQESAETP